MHHANPYSIDAPVHERGEFVGREDILNDVRRTLQHPNVNALFLLGQRRIGKTSLLLHLEQELNEQGDYLPLYLDLRQKASLSLEEILFQIAQQMSENLGIALPEQHHFDAQGRFFREKFVSKAAQQVGTRRIVLLIDEFDELDHPHHEQAGMNFFPFLTTWIDTDRNVQFVCALGRRPEELVIETLPAFKTIPFRRISLMTAEDCEMLIRQSERNDTLKWTHEAIERIWFWTQGHPYLIQLLCWVIWAMMTKRAIQKPQHSERIPTVSIDRVDMVIDDVLEQGNSAFQWFWNGLTPTQQFLMAALADQSAPEITHDHLSECLYQHGIRLTSKEVELSREMLLKWDIVAQASTKLSIAVPLLRLWLAFEKPLQQVKDAIEQLKKQVENLYRDGKTCYKQGNLQGAEDLLRCVLRRDPYHLRARLLLGPVLVGQGKPAAAVEEVELAYQLDPRLSKSVLIGTLLALARIQSETHSIATYYAILDIDPKQATALEKLLTIAERARQQGKLAKALMIYQNLGDQENVLQIKTLWAQRKTTRNKPGPKTIVVIEDSQFARTILGTELRKQGFHVIITENAELGHLSILKHTPDIIILDLNLPHLAGDDFGIMLRGAEETKEIPIIIFSVRPEQEIQQVVELTRAAGYVQKNQNLKACVTRLVEKIEEVLA